MNPISEDGYRCLFILALILFFLAKPALTANKDESTQTPQQENTANTPIENPFAKKPKKDNWLQSETQTEPTADESETRDEETKQALRHQLLMPYLESIRRWRNPPDLGDLSKLYNWRPRKKSDTKGIDLPMDSNLQITGFQSVTVEVNKTHYFGAGDLNRLGGYGYSGYGGYDSGLDLGLSSSYGYEDFGYSGFGGGYNSFGSGYGSGYSTYGSRGIPRASGINIRQQQKI